MSSGETTTRHGPAAKQRPVGRRSPHRPGGSATAQRHIAPRYTWNKFAPIDVVDGSINISFVCPSTFGCTVSGLLLYPAAMESVAASFVTELSAAMQALAHLTDDHIEGVTAVLEKRPGTFTGD